MPVSSPESHQDEDPQCLQAGAPAKAAKRTVRWNERSIGSYERLAPGRKHRTIDKTKVGTL